MPFEDLSGIMYVYNEKYIFLMTYVLMAKELCIDDKSSNTAVWLQQFS